MPPHGEGTPRRAHKVHVLGGNQEFLILFYTWNHAKISFHFYFQPLHRLMDLLPLTWPRLVEKSAIRRHTAPDCGEVAAAPSMPISLTKSVTRDLLIYLTSAGVFSFPCFNDLMVLIFVPC